jgi:hypothetical protein
MSNDAVRTNSIQVGVGATQPVAEQARYQPPLRRAVMAALLPAVFQFLLAERRIAIPDAREKAFNAAHLIRPFELRTLKEFELFLPVCRD